MNSPYYIPVAIHYYMLNKHSGYYARMQTFYSKDHYGPWAPIYFQNGAAYKQGLFSSSPEFYFATPNFLNSSGGYFRPYYDQNISALWDDAAAAKRTYHFTSKPNVLITRGDIGQYWGAEGDNYDLMSKEVMSTKGDWHNPGQSANIWVYKNFTYGFTWEKDVSSNYHTYWPAKYPPEWDAYATRVFSINRARFKIFDLRNVPVNKARLLGRPTVSTS